MSYVRPVIQLFSALRSSLDDAEKFAGAPVSLQLVARRYEDEKLLGILEMIQQALELPWAEGSVGS